MEASKGLTLIGALQMNTTLVRPTLKAVRRVVLGLSVAAGLAAASPASAAGPGGGGDMGGCGPMGGGGYFGGGGFRGGGYGWGRGGYLGGGRFYRGEYGYGGNGGSYPGLLGGLGLGNRLGFGYPGYGSGYGYPGYGLGYSGYGSGSGYVYPSSSNVVNSYGNTGYGAAPTSGFTYSSAYGTVPLQGTTSGAVSTWPLPSLGIDEQAVSDATGKQIAVARVHPGSAAERAGLQVGDKIVSANGFLAQEPGNLAWIINHHAPNGVVTLNVRKAATRQNASVSATLH